MSLMTREDMLRELELLPIWQLREPLKGVEKSPSVADTVIPVSVVSEVPISLEPVSLHEPMRQAEPAVVAEPVKELNQSPVHVEQVTQMNWQNLQQCVQRCQACSLAETRTHAVFGVGDPNADWLFVAEAPGAEEDEQGEPFVGQAGKLLDNMLASIQLKRGHHVYIANVLKCRPPENREPHREEVVQCEPYLKRQVELIQPKLIVALGKVAAQTLTESEDTVSNLRGQLHDYHDIPVIVTYHPAYLLRNLADKAKAWEDLCFAKDTMQNL